MMTLIFTESASTKVVHCLTNEIILNGTHRLVKHFGWHFGWHCQLRIKSELFLIDLKFKSEDLIDLLSTPMQHEMRDMVYDIE